MSALSTVVAWELRRLRRDTRVRVLGILLTLLTVVAALGAWNERAQAEHDRQAAEANDRAQWLAQGEKSPHGAAHFGFYAFRTPGALAVLDPGVQQALGATVWLEAHKQNEAKFRPLEHAGVLGRLGQATPAWILHHLVPLLLVLFSFAAIAGEREQGTLRLLLTQGVSPLTLMVGKALALGVATVVFLAPGMILAVVATVSQAAPGSMGDTMLALGIWGSGHAVYLAGILLVIVSVSALTTTRTALLILLACWIGNSLLAPRIAAALADQVHPLPSAAQFTAELAHDLPGHHDADAARRRKEEVLTKYGVTSIADLPFAFTGYDLLEDERVRAIAFDHHFAELAQVKVQQDRMRLWCGIMAPSTALAVFSAESAGTGRVAHEQFVQTGEQYRRAAMLLINEHIARTAARDVDWDARLRGDRTLWEQVPAFSTPRPSLNDALPAVGEAAAALGAWFLLVLGLSVIASRRMEIAC